MWSFSTSQYSLIQLLHFHTIITSLSFDTSFQYRHLTISLQSWLSNALYYYFSEQFPTLEIWPDTFCDAFFFFFFFNGLTKPILSSWFVRTVFINIGISCKYLSATAFTSDHQQQYQVAIPSSNQLFFSWVSATLHSYANQPVYSQNSAKLETQVICNYIKHLT